MGGGRPRRVAVAGLTAAVALATSTAATAGDEPPAHLILPLLASVAVGRSLMLSGAARLSGDPSGILGRSTFLSLLPSSLTIPDLYAVDPAERDPYRFAAPVNRKTYGSFNLLPARFAAGGTRSLSIAYATESVPALRDSSSLVRIWFELEF
jgi:hypothetical protein